MITRRRREYFWGGRLPVPWTSWGRWSGCRTLSSGKSQPPISPKPYQPPSPPDAKMVGRWSVRWLFLQQAAHYSGEFQVQGVEPSKASEHLVPESVLFSGSCSAIGLMKRSRWGLSCRTLPASRFHNYNYIFTRPPGCTNWTLQIITW